MPTDAFELTDVESTASRSTRSGHNMAADEANMTSAAAAATPKPQIVLRDDASDVARGDTQDGKMKRIKASLHANSRGHEVYEPVS